MESCTCDVSKIQKTAGNPSSTGLPKIGGYSVRMLVERKLTRNATESFKTDEVLQECE
jgi:hypothetical protein